MQNVKLCDAPSERSAATWSCRDDGPVRQDLAWRADGKTEQAADRGVRRGHACKSQAVGLISRQMAEGVGGEAGPGMPVKITTPL